MRFHCCLLCCLKPLCPVSVLCLIDILTFTSASLKCCCLIYVMCQCLSPLYSHTQSNSSVFVVKSPLPHFAFSFTQLHLRTIASFLSSLSQLSMPHCLLLPAPACHALLPGAALEHSSFLHSTAPWLCLSCPCVSELMCWRM